MESPKESPKESQKQKKSSLSLPPGVMESVLVDFQKGNLEEFKKLSPTGRDLVRQMVQTMSAGDTSLMEELYAIDYEHRRVDPETFFSHSDYLGHFREDIYDAWWPHLLEMCDPTKAVYEVILTGSLGIGKSTIGTGLVMSYHLHRLLCLKDPARFFGLGKGSKIVFGVYSLDLKSAEDIGFYILRDQMLGDSPFFNNLYRRAPHGTDEIKLPKNIVVKTGSQSLHVAGKNLFGIAVDEMNLMRKGKTTAKKAFHLANDVSRRLESRFMQSGGEIPGVTIFIGSAGSETDFIEKRIRKVSGKKYHYVVRGALWDFVRTDNEGRSKYSGETFRVQVGNKEYKSKILDRVIEVEDTGRYVIKRNEDADTGCNVVDVPVEHYTAFDIDTDGALRDLAGVSTQAFMKLFSNQERLKGSMQGEYCIPFDGETIGAYLFGPVELAYEFRTERVCKVRGSRYRPLRHPSAPRYIHIDLAKNQDKAGVAMVHPSSHFISVDGGSEPTDGIGLYDIRKEIEVDFAIAVECGPQRQPIDFANIRRLIFHIKRCGFWIRMVTTDSWESEDTHQRLAEAHIPVSNLSVDTTPMPYLIFRNAVNSGKVEMTWNQFLYDELVDLDYDVEEGKIDHPDEGSKDVADAVAGACYRCIIDKIKPSEVPVDHATPSQAEARLGKYLGMLKGIQEHMSVPE